MLFFFLSITEATYHISHKSGQKLILGVLFLILQVCFLTLGINLLGFYNKSPTKAG